MAEKRHPTTSARPPTPSEAPAAAERTGHPTRAPSLKARRAPGSRPTPGRAPTDSASTSPRPHRRGRCGSPGHVRVLPDDPPDRRGADVRGELLHRLVRRERKRISFPFYVDEVDTDIPDPSTWWELGDEHAAGSHCAGASAGRSVAPDDGRLAAAHRCRRCRHGGPSGRDLGRRATAIRGVGPSGSWRRRATTRLADTRSGTLGSSRPSRRSSDRRSSGHAPSRRPASGTPSWRSSTRSATPSPASSISRRSSSSSANGSTDLRVATRATCSSRSMTATATQITFPYWLDVGADWTSNRASYGDRPHLGRPRDETPAATRDISRRHRCRGDLPEGPAATESWLGVPIPSGGDAIGAVVIADPRAHAFSEADERIVSTIAASMGVALENARLFDATRTAERRAGDRQRDRRALAKQLDFEAIIELVGARIRDDLRRPLDVHRDLRPATRLISFPYAIAASSASGAVRTDRARRRAHIDRHRVGAAAAADVTLTRWSASGPSRIGLDAESWLGVPIHGRGPGPRRDRPREPRAGCLHRADVRLLSTLASSMGVALENARLFDETKRLLAETDQRAAELAVINTVQERPRRSSSTCRRCTTSSATRSGRSSTPRSSISRSSTAAAG